MGKNASKKATPNTQNLCTESENTEGFERIPCHGIVLELPHKDAEECKAIAAAEGKTVSDSIYDDVISKLNSLDIARRLLAVIRLLEEKSSLSSADLEELASVKERVLHVTARMFKDN